MKVLAICGSHRKNGNTKILLEKVLKIFRKGGIKTKLLDLLDYPLSFCQAHPSEICVKKCPYEKEFKEIEKELVSADAIIVGSPVYMGDIPARLKNFMDRTVRLRRKGFLLANKIGAAVVVGASQGGGQEQTINSIHNFFLIHDMIVVGDGKPGAHFGVVGIGKDKGDIKKDKAALEAVKRMGQRILELLKSSRR